MQRVLVVAAAVASVVLITNPSADAQRANTGGSLPNCREYCLIVSGDKGNLATCMKQNAAAGRCISKGKIQQKR